MPQDQSIRAAAISETYTAIMRQDRLEFYHVDNGPWERRNAPDFFLTLEETGDLFLFLKTLPEPEGRRADSARRDTRFFRSTTTALTDIADRAMQQPLELRYSSAYSILRGYFEALLTNFAEAFTPEQLAEIRIVLDQLSATTGEDTHLPDEARRQLAILAKALREAGEEA